jgi:amidase
MSLAEQTRWLDATAQAELVATGEVSPRELAEAAVERIEADDPSLNSVNLRWFDQSLDDANGVPDGPFRGVPFLLKDLECHVEGQPMSNGNVALAKLLPRSTFDTELVTRYRRAGLVFLGRTTSPEFGSLPVTESAAWGATRNPWDLDRTPGGSSGGSAAAVAKGMVPIAHGSDGGGSIRIPASCCGLFGFKPSQGRISMAPNRAETIVAVDHVLTRTVRDSALALDFSHGAGVGDVIRATPPTRPYIGEVGADPGRMRIGLMDHNPLGKPLPRELLEAVHKAAALLESLGHQVEPAFPAALDDTSTRVHYGIIRSPIMSLTIDKIAEQIGRPLEPGEVETFNMAQAEAGRTISAVDLTAAMAATDRYRRDVQQWWADGWDLLLTPTLSELPLPIGTCDPDPDDHWAALFRAGDFVPFTPPFNTTGQPAVNLPTHWTSDDLPVGVQLVAAYGREDHLLRVSSQVEAAQPWAHRTPNP